MKRTRVVVRIIIAVLVILMVVGIILLIMDESTNIKGTTYEIIAFVVGMSGMLMAIFSEIDANKQERQNDQMAREIRQLAEEEVKDTKLLKKILDKLDRRTITKKPSKKSK